MEHRVFTGILGLAASVSVLTGLLVFVGWKTSAAQEESVQVPYLAPSITIQELMLSTVEETAQSIWRLAYVGAEGGAERDLTDLEWRWVEGHALSLQAVATLVSLGGTGEADRGRAVSPAWQSWSKSLQDVAVAIQATSHNRDQPALFNAGDELARVCDGCHAVFKPDTATEGVHHMPEYW